MHLENVLVPMIDMQDIAIFKSQKDYVRNKQKLSEHVCYAQMWQVLSVIFSYAAFTCNIILTNKSNSGIPSTKANPISRTFPPLFVIKISEEEKITEDLHEIESMQLIVQIIMMIVCILIAFVLLYYCCKKFRYLHTLFKCDKR